MYKIQSIDYSIIRWGYHTGKRAIFVRFYGCNQACIFCGEQSHKYTEMTAHELLERVLCETDILIAEIKQIKPIVVFTGGEPLIQLIKDSSIIKMLAAAGFHLHLETNGTIEAGTSRLFNWVTCYPVGDAKLYECDELICICNESGLQVQCKEHPIAKYHYIRPLDSDPAFQKATYIVLGYDYDPTLRFTDWKLSIPIYPLKTFK